MWTFHKHIYLPSLLKTNTLSYSVTSLFVFWTILRAVVQEIFGHYALPNPRSSALFLMLDSNEFSLVPAQPGADGSVQHGITPADTVACQTGSHRPGHAKHSHTVLPYGNNVRWDHIRQADRVGFSALICQQIRKKLICQRIQWQEATGKMFYSIYIYI